MRGKRASHPIKGRCLDCNFCSGISLTECESRSKFLDILGAIHEVGILHGNLRLENLLVNDSGRVAIVDFDEAQKSLLT